MDVFYKIFDGVNVGYYEVYDDNSGRIIEGLCDLKKKIKNNK